LSAGVTLLLAGLSLGSNPWSWTNVRVLTSLVIGIVVLIVFGLYEWKGTKTGILHHELFRNRTFPICIALIFIEGIELFTIIVFYQRCKSSRLHLRDCVVYLKPAAEWWRSQDRSAFRNESTSRCTKDVPILGLLWMRHGDLRPLEHEEADIPESDVYRICLVHSRSQ